MKLLAVVFAVLLTLTGNAWAQKKDKDEPPASIMQGLKNRIGKDAPIANIRRSPLPGLWEFSINGDVLYTDVNGRYLFQGNLIDLNTRENLTEARSQIAAGSYASAEEVEARAADRRTKLIDKAGRTNAPELAEHRPQNRIVPTLSITLRKTILKRLFSSMNFSGAPRPVWAHIPC